MSSSSIESTGKAGPDDTAVRALAAGAAAETVGRNLVRLGRQTDVPAGALQAEAHAQVAQLREMLRSLLSPPVPPT